MLVEMTIAGLIVAAWRKSGKKEMSESQQKTYLEAMEETTDPEKLNKLADGFEKAGFKLHANMLRKRAELRGMTDEQKAQMRAVYDKAMASTKPEAVDRVAALFEEKSASGAAASLRKHAKELRAKAAEKKVVESKSVEETKAVIVDPITVELNGKTDVGKGAIEANG